MAKDTEMAPEEMPGLEDAMAAASEETPETPEMNEGSAIEIPVPAGFEAPEEAGDERPFDVLATVKMSGGKLLLEAIDGLPVMASAPETDEVEEAAEEEPADPDFMAAVEKGFADAKDEAVG
jgi:hypothetical protein